MIIAKVVSWRCISVLITLIVTLLMTGDVESATRMTVVLHLLLITTHYAFESIWENRFMKTMGEKKGPHWDD